MRYINWTSCGCFLVLSLAASLWPEKSWADEPEALLRRALEAEERGDLQQRRAYLSATLRQDAEHAAARWHSGWIRHQGTWRTPEEVARFSAGDAQLQQYLQHRRQVGSKADTQEALARWCRNQGLDARCRAHLLVGVRQAPNNAVIQKALGRSLHSGRWMTNDELRASRQLRQRLQKAYRSWRAELLKLRNSLSDDGSQEPAQTEHDLARICDPSAIAALEEVFSNHSEPLAILAVDLLDRMEQGAATESLIRHAVWSDWPVVRQRATQALKSRNPDHTISMLIELLRPTDSGSRWVPGIGHVWYWQDFTTTYVDRLGFPGEPGARLATDTRKGISRDESLQARYAKAEATNRQRLANTSAVLRELTGQDLRQDRDEWRRWWAQANFCYFDPASQSPDERTVVEQTSSVTMASLRDVSVISPASMSCFVAGTPVWTERGPIPIDTIELGDLVLSQRPETGELTYKPVIYRTIRPRTEICNLALGGETIGATLGHPVWVSGKGWVKVKDLVADDLLHGAGQVHRLTAVAPGRPDFGYNLEVAEFGTYFVGKSKVLVHDNSPIAHGPQTVPGLIGSQP